MEVMQHVHTSTALRPSSEPRAPLSLDPAAELDAVTQREVPEPVAGQITEVASDFALRPSSEPRVPSHWTLQPSWTRWRRETPSNL
jgi:hypothetical protein